MTQRASSTEGYALLKSATGAVAASRGRLEAVSTGVTVSQGEVSLALDSDGRPLVLIPLADGEAVADDTESKGVSLRARSLSEGESLSQFLVLRCEDQGLDRQFALLADDVLMEVSARQEFPLQATREVLDRWRELLGPRRDSVMSREQLAGLFAELRLMEELAKRRPQEAQGWWTGWDKSRHDFKSGAAAIEVKATLKREQFLVRMHGLWQLEPPAELPLYLLGFQMESVPAGGDCVPDVIERIRNAGVTASELTSALAKSGYLALHEDHYRRNRFEVLQSKLIEIDASVPRVTPSVFADARLAAGVIGVEYSIDVGVLPGVAEDALRSAVARLLGEHDGLED